MISQRKLICMVLFQEGVTESISSGRFITKGCSFPQLMKKNNCVKIGHAYFLIRNILTLKISDHIILPLEQFLTVSDFFQIGDSPQTILKSSDLGIVKVSDLSGMYETRNVMDTEKKCVLLPYKQKFVLVPLSSYQY